MGQGIVIIQLACSILSGAIIIGKAKELNRIIFNSRRFQREFNAAGVDVLAYYLQRRKGGETALDLVYTRTCERVVKLLGSELRDKMIRERRGTPGEALTAREVELIRGTCEHTVQEEEIRISHGMTGLACIVTISPMLGLLGTVWGVLDAFDVMGAKGTVLLSEIAPAISSALVTTVVGLLVAIPSAGCYNYLASRLRRITTDMVGLADELMGRIACEYQGREI